MDGGFRFPLTYREDGESIEISSMGYDKKEFELQKLSPNDINILYLTAGVLSLSEAVVSAKKKRELSAKRIVRRAIENIPNNYPSSNFAAVGYYRDYQIREDEYVNLNEAILEVVDMGFQTNDYNDSKVRIYDYQRNKNFKRDVEGGFRYDYKNYKKFIDKAYLQDFGGNEFNILRIHDAIRNNNINSYDFVNVMERDFISNHSFRKEDDIIQDQEPLYVIDFGLATQPIRVYGKLYISKKDFSIHKMEYTLYDRNRKMENGQLNKHGSDYKAIFDVITEYRHKYGRMYPNYISFYNTFETAKPPVFTVVKVLLDRPKACLVVRFNDVVDWETAQKKTNHDLRFEGKKMALDKIKVFRDKVELYPKISGEDFNKLYQKINAVSLKKLDSMKLLTAEITGVFNRDRTFKVNEMVYKTYKQYREFFVQEVKPKGSILTDTLFMDKNVPIFKNQPMLKPDNFDEYWMNTPLKKIDN